MWPALRHGPSPAQRPRPPTPPLSGPLRFTPVSCTPSQEDCLMADNPCTQPEPTHYGPAAQPAYRVLAQALRQRRRAALGRLVLSGRRQVALVGPAGRLLALHLLHYPAQLRSPAALEAELRPGPVGEVEARLAGELLDAYSRPLRWADYRDDSAQHLAALVEARLRGDTPRPPAPEESPVPNLLEALRQSVAALHSTPAMEAPAAGPVR